MQKNPSRLHKIAVSNAKKLLATGLVDTVYLYGDLARWLMDELVVNEEVRTLSFLIITKLDIKPYKKLFFDYCSGSNQTSPNSDQLIRVYRQSQDYAALRGAVKANRQRLYPHLNLLPFPVANDLRMLQKWSRVIDMLDHNVIKDIRPTLMVYDPEEEDFRPLNFWETLPWETTIFALSSELQSQETDKKYWTLWNQLAALSPLMTEEMVQFLLYPENLQEEIAHTCSVHVEQREEQFIPRYQQPHLCCEKIDWEKLIVEVNATALKEKRLQRKMMHQFWC